MCEINVKEALKLLGGSMPLYRTLIQGFCDKYFSIDIVIHQALIEFRIEDARRLAHSMKGLSGNLGAEGLQKKAEAYEIAIKGLLLLSKDDLEILPTEVLELGKNFSDELKITLKWLNCLLNMENSEIDIVNSLKDIDC